MKTGKKGWVCMAKVKTPMPDGPDDRIVQVAAVHYGVTPAEAYKRVLAEQQATDTFINDIYQVTRRVWDDEIVQLNIRRRDGKPIFRDWRHFQQIKNELVGEENEAVELYPAESRKVDTGNKYHLFCLRSPTARFNIGWQEGLIADTDRDNKGVRGLRQRKL